MNNLSIDQKTYFEEQWKIEQIELKKKLILENDFDWNINNGLKYIGGVDISFIIGNEEDACVGLVILAWPSLEIVYKSFKMVKLTLPYIPSFLAFREVDHIIELINELKMNDPDFLPQIILVDGNGYLHPRGFGLACHLGVLTNIPTIGVSKNFYVMDGLAMHETKNKIVEHCKKKGEYYKLIGLSGTCWGAGLIMSDDNKRPLYISSGHRINLETAIDIVNHSCRYRMPEPIRQADLGSRDYLRNSFPGAKITD